MSNSGEALIQTAFLASLRTGVSELISKLGSEVATEFEFRLRTHVIKGNKTIIESGQSMLQFKNIMENLQRAKYKLTESSSLDITIKKPVKAINIGEIRTTIDGVPQIRAFCLSEKISGLPVENVSYLQKAILGSIKDKTIWDSEAYGLRGSFANETAVKNESLIKSVMDEIDHPSSKKLYRYKQRFSFQSKIMPVRFDLTMIKSNEGNSFKGARVLGQKEKYEVEIEYTGGEINKNTDPIMLADNLQADLYNLVKWSQDSLAVITNSSKLAIYHEYLEKVFPGQKIDWSKDIDARRFFASVDVMPLKLEHVRPDKEGHYLLEEGFSVTDKADGEHHFLFVSNHPEHQGEMYLINNRMEIKHTGMRTANPLLYGSLLDGELVKSKAVSKTAISMSSSNYTFLIFDCLFWGNQNIRPLPLYIIDANLEKITKVECRYQAMIRFMTEYVPMPMASEISFGLDYKRYKFRIPGDKKTIFNLTAEVYLPDKYSYNLDGVIFTPFNDPYPEARLGVSTKWPGLGLLKWKEIKHLSIDFMNEMNKENGKEVVKNDQDPKTKEEWKYKEGQLQVYNKGKHQPFAPTQYADDNVNKILIKLDVDGQMRALDGDIIYSGAFVECAYNAQGLPGYQWIPLRLRSDKLHANAVTTADSTWLTIKLPITQEMITGHQPIDTQSVIQSYAKEVDDKQKLAVASLSFFHNAIKSVLIRATTASIRKTNANKTVSLLDPTAGEGGDLHKWTEAEINYVLATDYDSLSLSKPGRGAIARYDELRIERTKEHKKYPKVMFACADASQNLSTGEAGRDATSKQLLLDEFSKRGPSSFDIVSCQFAFHYMCENATKMASFLQNVAQNLTIGGYFIGTTLAGNKVYQGLQGQDKLSGFNKGVKIWELSADYPPDQSFQPYGQRINAYNVKLDNHPEYLVNFDYFIQTAEKFGLKLVPNGEFDNLNNLKGTPINGISLQGVQSFGDLFEPMRKWDWSKKNLDKLNKMSPDEKTYSFMNNYFIFKKVSGYNQQAVMSDLSVASSSAVKSEVVKMPTLYKAPGAFVMPTPSAAVVKPVVAVVPKVVGVVPKPVAIVTKPIAIKPIVIAPVPAPKKLVVGMKPKP